MLKFVVGRKIREALIGKKLLGVGVDFIAGFDTFDIMVAAGTIMSDAGNNTRDRIILV